MSYCIKNNIYLKNKKIFCIILDKGLTSIYNENVLQDNEQCFDEKCSQISDEELVLSAQQGDDVSSDALIVRYSDFVRYLARPYFLVGGDAEDLIQEGMIGLIKAIREYNASQGVLFKTFAGTCIKNKLLSALKQAARNKHNPLNHYISLEPPFFDSNPEHVDFALTNLGISGDPVELVIGNEAFKELSQVLRGLLSGFEAKVLELYLEGRSYQEIADLTNKTSKAIDNAVQRIRRKLAHYFHSKASTGA